MARNQRFPNARSRRRPHGRYLLLGAAAALVVLLAIPAAGPRGSVLDLKGNSAPAAIGQEPTPPRSATTAWPSLAPTATPSAPPSSSPSASLTASPTAPPSLTPSAPPATESPSAAVGVIGRAAGLGIGGFPTRLQAEMAGPTPAPPATLTGYVWPLAHPRLTLPFGPTPWGSRLVGGRPFHDGVDLATFCGDRVMAAHAGRVIAAGRHYDDVMGWIGDLGRYYRRLDSKRLWQTLPIIVVTDDGNGYRSMYAHFGRIVVKTGQHVRAGQLLGYEGATGRASGCHVHYGLFSPRERATFAMKPDVAKRMKLPKREIARVDPLLVLPPRRGINAPAKPKPSATPATAG